MGLKNYGTGVSGYLDPEYRGWETVVQQAGKPLLDKELNLTSDLKDEPARDAGIRTGWIGSNWLKSENAPYFSSSPSADHVEFDTLGAYVNGWTVLVHQTHSSTSNILDLGTSPAGAGAKRTDLVILEVWRRLISASPDATGKSPSERIWKYGNVKLFDPGDPNLDINNNLADDILDTNVGSETSKRVQVQYRLRVIQGVDLFAYPEGIDDPVVFANSVPTTPTSPDGVATAFNYAMTSDLWRAGDGNPSNTLGTVDGYMYALPLCAVFRRNSTAFDRNTNHNGGVASPGPSDRPDGLFYDVIVNKDIADLQVTTPDPEGEWSSREVLERNVHYLLDNMLCTEWMTTPNGAGMNGHTPLWADEIGVSNANGGDGVTTGDTPGAEFVGQFDAVRREFSDRPILEVATVVIPCPGASWSLGDTVLISPASLAVYPYSSFNWAAYAPSEVTFLDVVQARFNGYDAAHVSTEAALARVEDLGTRPQIPATVTMGAIPAGVTDEDLVLDVLIAYPPGTGLAKTPVETYGSASLTYNNPAQLPATSPIYYDATVFAIDAPHREASIRYTTVPITLALAGPPAPASEVYLPERAESVTSVDINAGPPETFTLSADGRVITITSGTPGPGDVVNVTYVALRPFPQNDEQVTIWYDIRAIQTIRDANLPSSFDVAFVDAGDDLQVLTVGSGSLDEAYPYPTAYVQLGAVNTPAGESFDGDHELDASAHITVSNFDADTGWLKLPSFLPMAVSSGHYTLNRPGGSGEVDSEGRTYYSEMTSSSYSPNAYAQQLSDPKKHKIVLPVLVKVEQDEDFSKPNRLVLLLLTRWASFDPDNGVWFDTSASTNATCASVLRLKGNPLGRRFS